MNAPYRPSGCADRPSPVRPRSQRPPFEIFQRQTELVGIELLRAPAELHPLQLAKQVAQPINVTGLAVNAAEIAAKRLQLLQEAVPGLSRVALLWNARFPAMVLQFHNIEQASPQLGVILQSIRVTGGPDHFDQAFAAIEASHPQGLVVLYGPLRGNDLPRIVEFVMQRKLPTIFQLGEGVRGGGLMEFGPKNDAMFRRTAAYIDKLMVPTRLSSRLKSRANSSSKSI